MSIWEPFDPVTYFSHTILGGLGIVGALIALTVLKGSSGHIWAGRLFVFAAFVAAATALVFSFTTFSGPAIASSVITFSCLGAAVLALKPRSRAVLGGEIVTTFLMGAALLWMLFGSYMSIQNGRWLIPLLYSLFPLVLLIGDLTFLRLDQRHRSGARLPRHYSRMGFALAIAVHAPIVSFGDDLGLHPALAFFGPFVIWPTIVLYFNRRQAKNQLVLASSRSHSSLS